jgi:hypothetical protein
MDREWELTKAKWLLGAVVFFLIACYLSYEELVYLIWGREVQASVTQTFVAERGRRRIPMLTVEYKFTEPDGTSRSDSDDVQTDWPLPSNKTVAVVYIPGKDGRSRLKGHGSWLGPVLLAVSIGVVGFFAIRLWRQAAMATKSLRKNNRG